jgi:hypothetical protein
MGRPIKTAKAHAVITITNTTATTNVVTTTANLNNLGIIAGMPIILSNSIGGLTANTIYWVLEVLTNNTFTVSSTVLNANVNRTPVTLTTASGTVAATVAPVSAYFGNPAGAQWPNTNTNTYGVVGGDSAIIGNQIVGNAHLVRKGPGTIQAVTTSTTVEGNGTNFTSSDVGSILYTIDDVVIGTISSVTDADTVVLSAPASVNYTGEYKISGIEQSFIIRQKGKQKYLVKGTVTGTVSSVYTVNSTVSPQPINTIVLNSSSGAIQSVSNKSVELFTADSGTTATLVSDLSKATPALASFNGAISADPSVGIPYNIVDVDSL